MAFLKLKTFKNIALFILLLSQSGCSQSRIVTDCHRLQLAIYIDPHSTVLETLKTGKTAAVYASKQQAVLADQLAQIPLSDRVLSTYRNNLVDLYRHDSDLGLQVSAFMSDEGQITVADGNRSAYEQVAGQRIAISQQVQQQQATIASYCEAQEYAVDKP